MVDIAPAFARFVVNRLMDHPPHQGGFRNWLQHGTYTVELQTTPLVIRLLGISPAEALRFVLFDYSRFAFSSAESIAKSYEPIFDAKAIAWRLLNQYYASFFAGHALLRSRGLGVTRIERTEANYLQKVIRATSNPAFNMDAGTYKFTLTIANDYNATIEISKLAQGSGGAHAEFWVFFSTQLEQFSTDLVAENRPDAAQIVGRVDELRRLLGGPEKTNFSWLSSMRNEINYQHKFGTWFPFYKATETRLPEINVLRQSNSALSLAVSTKNAPIEAFCRANNFLSLLNIDVAQLLSRRGGKGAAQFSTEWKHLLQKLKIKR